MRYIRWFLMTIGLIVTVGALMNYLALAFLIGLGIVFTQTRLFLKENPVDQ